MRYNILSQGCRFRGLENDMMSKPLPVYVLLLYHKVGAVRIGGKGDKPEFLLAFKLVGIF